MKFSAFLLAAFATSMVVACEQTPDEVGPNYDGLTEVTYTSHDKRMVNPERGFYTQKSYHSVGDGTLSKSAVSAARTAGRSLFLTLFYLTDYIDSDIEQAYLDNMQTTFNNLREGGAKAVVRFAYKNNESNSNKPWDATQEMVARHIEQVTPILNKNADVIYTVQAGFIGVWGEWYYTSNFHYPIKTDEQYADRRKVVDALLKALPKDRQVELRTPNFKMRMYGVTLADTITVATAHNGSDLSRLAGHNDCFLASTSDTGTFDDKRGTGDWLFWDAETRYTIMGGETCGTGAKLHHCENAIQRMEEQHWSYMNIGYHQDVISTWQQEKCFPEIENRLGYRLALTNAYFTPKAVAGGDFRVVLNIANNGFAAPMNPRGCELVLVGGSKEYNFKINTDPRFWFEKCVTTIDTTITLPADLAAGEYKLYLNLPDGYESLAKDAKFSIQLANDNVWDAKTGYNRIHTITVE